MMEKEPHQMIWDDGVKTDCLCDQTGDHTPEFTMIEFEPSEPVVTCGAQEARCICVKPAGHVEAGDDVHACDAGCGGAWAWRDGQFVPVGWPGIAGTGTGLPR